MADASFQFFNNGFDPSLNTDSSLSFSFHIFLFLLFLQILLSLLPSNPTAASPWQMPFLMLPWTPSRSASCSTTSASSISRFMFLLFVFWFFVPLLLVAFDFDLCVVMLSIDSLIDWFLCVNVDLIWILLCLLLEHWCVMGKRWSVYWFGCLRFLWNFECLWINYRICSRLKSDDHHIRKFNCPFSLFLMLFFS